MLELTVLPIDRKSVKRPTHESHSFRKAWLLDLSDRGGSLGRKLVIVVEPALLGVRDVIVHVELGLFAAHPPRADVAPCV